MPCLHFAHLNSETATKGIDVEDPKSVLEKNIDILGISNFAFLAKVIVWALLLATGVTLFFDDVCWKQQIGAALGVLMIVHGVELQHQALHNTGFTSRILNRIVGFFLGLPLFISYAHYKDRHLHHHQHLGTSLDSEFFQYSKEKHKNAISLVSSLLMLPHWSRVGRLMIAALVNRSVGPIHNAKNHPAIRTDYLLFSLAIGGLLLGAVGLHNPDGLKVLFLVFLAAPVHTLIELPEHFGCARGTDIYRNTRSIRSNRLMTWFTNGNNFHVEHHLISSVIPERLHILHRRVRPQIVFFNSSYREFVGLLIRNPVKG